MIGLIITILLVIAALAIYEFVPTSTAQRVDVLTTFYPLYDFTSNIVRGNVTVSVLVPETVDVHDFEPTPSSVSEAAKAHVLIYNGAGLEVEWISKLVAAADNPKLILVDSSQGIPLLPVLPQFQKDNRTVDPHIWLDPELAKQQVNNILQGLIKAYPENQQNFTANARAYEAQLDQLNSQIINETTNVKTRYFVTFHEAFGYFAGQYNLTQIPIAGPFEEEPTPSDIDNVISAIHQYHLNYVGYESLENPDVSRRIAAETNATLIMMNPIEGLTQQERNAGDTYLILMQEDLANIVLALKNV